MTASRWSERARQRADRNSESYNIGVEHLYRSALRSIKAARELLS